MLGDVRERVSVSDALGITHELQAPPRRIVSLVPSITEWLFTIGAGETVVGVTDYCVHPAREVNAGKRVGGTKNPRLEEIAALEPDLVLANKEENRKQDVERLREMGLRVFVSYPRTVSEALEELQTLARITRREDAAEPLTVAIREVWERVRVRRTEVRPKVVALIWKKPYRTVNGDTFAHDMIVQSGGVNPFAASAERYPRIDETGLVATGPDVILLPTEPYPFGTRDRDELLSLDCPAARHGRIHVVEGELLTWYGHRMSRGLEVFSGLFGYAAF